MIAKQLSGNPSTYASHQPEKRENVGGKPASSANPPSGLASPLQLGRMLNLAKTPGVRDVPKPRSRQLNAGSSNIEVSGSPALIRTPVDGLFPKTGVFLRLTTWIRTSDWLPEVSPYGRRRLLGCIDLSLRPAAGSRQHNSSTVTLIWWRPRWIRTTPPTIRSCLSLHGFTRPRPCLTACGAWT
jgi:hypothetical protein